MVSSERIEVLAALIAAFALGMTANRLAVLTPAAEDLVAAGFVVVLLLATGLLVWSRQARRALALKREREARAQAEARMHHLSRHDALTGLLNRGMLIEHLQRVADGGRRGDRSAAVLTLDLQDFKAINETYGHAAGDLLLRHAGSRLLAHLRETDVLARMGADEFAIVQNDVPGPGPAAALAERLIAALDEPFDLLGQVVPVRASVGIAICPVDGDTAEVLLQRSALALGRAKSEAPGSAAFFETGMDAEVRRRKILERDLHLALERHELELHYQPQIDLESRRVVGVEALARWTHPEHGRVPPDVFIPLAEDCGLIAPIGAWVLEQACAQARAWHAAGAEDLRMSVNLSPVQFRNRDLAGEVGATLQRTGLEARHLELEITERVLIEDSTHVLETLDRLRALGVRISVDDFGIGHASLSYLQRFAFDEIKVDRAFVAALGRSPSAAAILRAAMALGRSLDMTVVAEGVENEAQLRMLMVEECPIAQGYYFSPPRPVGEMDILIRTCFDGASWEGDENADRSVA